MRCLICNADCDAPEAALCPVCTARAGQFGEVLVNLAREFAREHWREHSYAMDLAWLRAIQVLREEYEAVRQHYAARRA